MNVAQAQFQAGLAALGQNRVTQALSAFEMAARLAPRAAPAHHMVGIALQRLGRLKEADAAITRAITINPREADFHSNRALVRCGQERFDLAIADAEAAVRLEPTHIGGLCNLGLAQLGARDYPAAAKSFTRLIRASPSFVSAYENASLAVGNIEDPDTALAAATAFAQAAPNYPIAQTTLGNVLATNGDVRGADAQFVRSLKLAPGEIRTHSLRLFNLNYLEDLTDAARGAMVANFTTAVSAAVTARAHQPRPGTSEKPLRIGLVSADFRHHSVSFFLQTVVPALRARGLFLVAYSNVYRGDEVTERMKPEFDLWRDIRELDDAVVADRIAADEIDILLDLSGHTGGNRQRLFAMRPAPLAVAWLGFSATTGNPGIDYVIGDARVLPEADRGHFTERPLRLPNGYLCFSPPGTEPATVEPGQPMTFGSFNTLNKVSDRTVALWSRILASAPQSRLLLKTRALDSAEIRERTLKRFTDQGVDPARLELLGHTATRAAHLKLYGRVHLALDPWPYAGTTTTMEALSMGVPVLTLDEGRFISRVSASLLDAAGLGEWIAADETAYLDKAVAAAADLEGLIASRAEIARQVRQSPLYDAASFAADFDAAMRSIWRDWCAGSGANVGKAAI